MKKSWDDIRRENIEKSYKEIDAMNRKNAKQIKTLCFFIFAILTPIFYLCYDFSR